MDAFFASLIERFGLPSFGLPAIFIWSTVSATVIPMGSEPVVFGYVKLNPEQFWVAILVATAGNALGGAITYWMGRGARQAFAPDRQERYLKVLHRFGPKAMFLAFLPVVGDPLCGAAGWARLSFWPCLAWMSAGKLVRYVVMTAFLLWVPDSFWQQVLAPVQRLFGWGG